MSFGEVGSIKRITMVSLIKDYNETMPLSPLGQMKRKRKKKKNRSRSDPHKLKLIVCISHHLANLDIVFPCMQEATLAK